MVVISTLGIFCQQQEHVSGLSIPKGRKAEYQIIDVIEGHAYELDLEFFSDACDIWARDGPFPNSQYHKLGRVVKFTQLSRGIQPALTPEEVNSAEIILRSDPRIIELAVEVGVKPENIFADGWSIGFDDRFSPEMRLQQCLIFCRKNEHENLYAHPMDFSAVIDCNSNQVVAIDFARHRRSKSLREKVDGRPGPIVVSPEKARAYANRERIYPPMRSYDYLPDLMFKDPAMPQIRNDLKPLHILQPEGVSFQLENNEIMWQKWKFHVGFHPRDGLVISTVTYNDNGCMRPLIYRMSIAEMVVPYAETQHPHPRKFAFDVGEYGMGTLANSLRIGCDCLGAVAYLDGCYISLDGSPVTIPNCICIHEEDAGIAWKHTDYRQGGRTRSARSRRLVVQMTCTIANYEYIFNYNFYTDGSIQLETKLSGILNLYCKRPGLEETNPYGVEVAKGVNAHHHQHLFCLRLDPMIDGIANTLIQSDVVPTPSSLSSSENHAGNGFLVERTILDKAGGYDWDASRHRVWSIVNHKKLHKASGLPSGLKIHTKDWEPLLAPPESHIGQRAQFASHPIWISQFREDQLWPAGKYVTQSRGVSHDSIGPWTEDQHKVDDEDIVVWITYGITHIARPEDFPVMPVEHLSIWLKPTNFFDFNPAHDLPEMNDPYSRHTN